MASKGNKLIRQNTITVQSSALTGNCIEGFINYVKTKGEKKKIQKWKNTDINTVVENLIEIMIMKGYKKISFPAIDSMKSAIDKPKFTRTQMFDFIAKFAGKQNLIVTSDARDELTVSGSALSQATLAADENYYCRTYEKCDPSIKPIAMKNTEIDLANKIRYDNKIEKIKSGNKKECSTCWICGNTVYVYELQVKINPKKPNELETVYISCGQDEHVSPPGLGNLFGLLYPDKQSQIDAILIKDGYAKYGLRSSHDWCNQVKSDYNLISPPKGPSKKNYTINEESLDLIIKKAKEWLDTWDTNRIDIDILFHKKLTNPQKNSFLAKMRSTMSGHLNDLCNEMNINVPIEFPGGNNNPYTSYTLRLIFFSCFIGCNVLFKNIKSFQTSWKKAGGLIKNQYGGQYSEQVEQELNRAFRLIVGIDDLNNCYNLENIESKYNDVSSDTPSTPDNNVINEMPGESVNLYNSIIRQQIQNNEETINKLETLRDLPIRQERLIELKNTNNELKNNLNENLAVVSMKMGDNDVCPDDACDNQSGNIFSDLYKKCCPTKLKTAGSNLKNKSKKNKYRKIKRTTKKRRNNTKKTRKRRGGVKNKEQIQKEIIERGTPIRDPIELNRLAEADRIAEEREKNDNEIRRVNFDLERQRINTIKSLPTTPMSPEEIRRQNREDELHNKRVNSSAAKSRKLTLADLGGSKRRKHTKMKKTRGGNRIGGNNIGANCYNPNFSIYNTNLLKLFPYKGGDLQVDDIYKNNEGPQF